MARSSIIITILTILTIVLAGCGQQQIPPTPRPTQTPLPQSTAVVPKSQIVSGVQTLAEISGLLDVRLAVHLRDNWPATGMSYRHLDVPIETLYRVFDPRIKQWGLTIGVDRDVTVNGDDQYFSNFVQITDDNTVHAIWGPADATDDSVYHAVSTDFGETWSDPLTITHKCVPIDSATDGTRIVFVARCNQPPFDTEIWLHDTGHAGQWTKLTRLPFVGFHGMALALTLATDTTPARIILWQSAFKEVRMTSIGMDGQIIADTGDLPYPDGHTPLWGWHASGRGYLREVADENGAISRTPSVSFAWAGFDYTAIYVISSFDNGVSWQPIELAAGGGDGTESPMDWASPIYDPISDSLLVVMTCCSGRLFSRAGDAPDRTHYLIWKHIGGLRSWSTAQTAWTSPRLIATGALQLRVGRTAVAHGSRTIWLAWTEHDHRVRSRTLEIGNLLPPQAYPPDTTLPTPGVESTPPSLRGDR